MPAHIQKLSPAFVAIYREAEEAKQLGLLQIAGPGYRKAFEFLIKDYAIAMKPDNAAEIKEAFSGSVVKNYVPDPRIAPLAERSLWLGNDETHYLRKWVDHDIKDLIRLIDLTMHWMEIDLSSKEYLATLK
ncbi:MAG: hypothetical protein WAW96_07115 [Alphaproteobacteria bacterium]